MAFASFAHLFVVATLMSLVASFDSSANSTGVDLDSDICHSFGVDFVDEGKYFINSLSNEQFTCVSTFAGCKPGFAEVLLVDPKGNEVLCSTVPTTPDGIPELSTCPVKKNQMSSGEHMILVFGNNGDGQPFAWQRDLYLDIRAQVTSTHTPTVTFSITTTPVVSLTQTSTLVITSTIGPNLTFTLPTGTASEKKTITPSAVTSTSTKTLTRVKTTWTKDLSITSKTVTATCTTSTPEKPDKPCTYSPTLRHPEALVTPTEAPKVTLSIRRDRAVSVKYARSRIEAAKRLQRAQKAAAHLEKRAPDEPVFTVIATIATNMTTTYTAPATTTTESTIVSSTTTLTLPPVTLYSGLATATVTLPVPTKTRFSFTTTTRETTKTIHATWTRTTVVTPSASLEVCKQQGGRIV